MQIQESLSELNLLRLFRGAEEDVVVPGTGLTRNRRERQAFCLNLLR